jgi:hypothetical protein
MLTLRERERVHTSAYVSIRHIAGADEHLRRESPQMLTLRGERERERERERRQRERERERERRRRIS